MSQTKTLLELVYHTDSETGIDYIGEIDFGIHGELNYYLKIYGNKGKTEIINMLAYLIYYVEDKYRNIIKAEIASNASYKSTERAKDERESQC